MLRELWEWLREGVKDWWPVFLAIAAIMGFIKDRSVLLRPLRWLIGLGSSLRAWWRKVWAANWAAKDRADRLMSYEDCLARETADGRAVPVRHSGYLPTQVTYSDGTETYHYNGQYDAYKRGMESRQYPLQRTFPGAPPPCPCGQVSRKSA